MAITEKIYVGDVGTEIVLDVKTNVSEATVLQFKVRKPNGVTVVWSAVGDGGNFIKHVVEPGDLNVAGEYLLQAYVEIGTFKGHSSTTKFTVYERFS